MSLEDLEKFALRPAPRDVTIQCRVTRDRRGMEKGIYPTYYLHMEKEDGKRVGHQWVTRSLKKAHSPLQSSVILTVLPFIIWVQISLKKLQNK